MYIYMYSYVFIPLLVVVGVGGFCPMVFVVRSHGLTCLKERKGGGARARSEYVVATKLLGIRRDIFAVVRN